MINKIYKNLKWLKTLKPNVETNKIFSSLVNYCVENNLNIEYTDIVKEINNYCSIAEYELEKYTVLEILKSDNPKGKLKEFVYYKNYLDLTKFEYMNSSLFINQINNVLFIWWWPLPLTAIVLAYEYWVKSVIVDINEEAVELSKKLVEKIGLGEYIKIIKWDAINYVDSNKYDICYIASLVFWWINHLSIIENIWKINFDLLLTRTSHWSRELLYKKVDIEILNKYFNIQLISHPKNKIINSIILSYKK